MKKLILLVALALPLMGQAQPSEGQDWWACQAVQSAGLSWEDGRWEAARFRADNRFILVARGNGITTESAAKAMETNVGGVTCSSPNSAGHVYCISNWVGTSLVFGTRTGNGAIAEILGGASDGDTKDTLSVDPFECVKG